MLKRKIADTDPYNLPFRKHRNLLGASADGDKCDVEIAYMLTMCK